MSEIMSFEICETMSEIMSFEICETKRENLNRKLLTKWCMVEADLAMSKKESSHDFELRLLTELEEELRPYWTQEREQRDHIYAPKIDLAPLPENVRLRNTFRMLDDQWDI